MDDDAAKLASFVMPFIDSQLTKEHPASPTRTKHGPREAIGPPFHHSHPKMSML